MIDIPIWIFTDFFHITPNIGDIISIKFNKSDVKQIPK